MGREQGLRDRKKAQTRERIADVAAGLFAERNYEAVSIMDVARAANVSDQTVYNYFPAKQDLVLDRVDEFLELYRRAVLDRAEGVSPADALRPLVEADIDRYRHADPRLARGEFPAQCVDSPVLRRFALEFRERQADAVAASILSTCPALEPIVARAHAAALISVVQTITDRIGAGLLTSVPSDALAAEMTQAAATAFDDLDRTFRAMTTKEPS
ncbi:TetR/AcrR family transcriptional regulator [Actinoplanes sp. N902-109]|uniref:TetR/AcrR family transcriptional regulator n=1 Tax=Actinoplanes sp. (strain N902-109) TaxID=649831 RepID=UPI0003295CDB|nr:TetR/AcrR family transcriptional regulator [Actinoplanes sp. N902-109]AGL17462.1 TetR family transcriptional regulator [Actinoplanes sp. N902-109]